MKEKREDHDLENDLLKGRRKRQNPGEGFSGSESDMPDSEPDAPDWEEDDWEEPDQEKPWVTILTFVGLAVLAGIICFILWQVTHPDRTEGENGDPGTVESSGDSEGSAGEGQESPEGSSGEQVPGSGGEAVAPGQTLPGQEGGVAGNGEQSAAPGAGTTVEPGGGTDGQEPGSGTGGQEQSAGPGAGTVVEPGEETDGQEPGGETGGRKPGSGTGGQEQSAAPGAGTVVEPGGETDGQKPGGETDGQKPGGETDGQETAGGGGQKPQEGNASMTFADRKESVTPKDVVNLRSVPATADEKTIVVQIQNGEVLTRTGINTDTGWSRISYGDQTLYAVTQYLTTDLDYKTPVQASNPNRVSTISGRIILFSDCDDWITPKEYVNLRTEPSTTEGDSTVSCQLNSGEKAHRTGYSTDSGWSRVEYNGQVLYVVTSLMNETEPD